MHGAASVDRRVWLLAATKATLGSHTKAKAFMHSIQLQAPASRLTHSRWPRLEAEILQLWLISGHSHCKL